MTAGTHQAITLYEDSGLSLEEIAAQLDIELEAVKVALLQFSPKYRAKLADKSSEEAATFKDDDFKAAAQVMASLVHSRDENVSLRAAKFVINEHKGRHDPTKLRSLNINIHAFNDTLRKAREATERAKQKQLIEIDAISLTPQST